MFEIVQNTLFVFCHTCTCFYITGVVQRVQHNQIQINHIDPNNFYGKYNNNTY